MEHCDLEALSVEHCSIEANHACASLKRRKAPSGRCRFEAMVCQRSKFLKEQKDECYYRRECSQGIRLQGELELESLYICQMCPIARQERGVERNVSHRCPNKCESDVFGMFRNSTKIGRALGKN